MTFDPRELRYRKSLDWLLTNAREGLRMASFSPEAELIRLTAFIFNKQADDVVSDLLYLINEDATS